VNGPTVSEYYGLIRPPKGYRLPYLVFRLCLPVPGLVVDTANAPDFCRSLSGLPSSWRFSPHTSSRPSTCGLGRCVLRDAALFVDPDRPSESSPKRSLCIGFPGLRLGQAGAVRPSPPALSSMTGLYHLCLRHPGLAAKAGRCRQASGIAVSLTAYVVPWVRFSCLVRL